MVPPIFHVVAIIALVLSYRRIWYPAISYNSVEVCNIQKSTTPYKAIFVFVALLILFALMLPYTATNNEMYSRQIPIQGLVFILKYNALQNLLVHLLSNLL
ncbi:MAG: hypothetical protein E4H07_09910 [Nitrosomonadales bacterium]|nr:MAG: hypothetical protein E4H07_09910 [Nitrosomonadales bacterium]